MVYQDPGSALNPSIPVGAQIAEVYRFHRGMGSRGLRAPRKMLETGADIRSGRMLRRYPHELSGGQQQRIMFAMALATDPALLVLDEPTTGLDATVEAEVLDLVRAMRGEFNTAILFISHNLGIVARMCERVGVLYAGRLIEEGPRGDVPRSAPPLHAGATPLRAAASARTSARSRWIPLPASAGSGEAGRRLRLCAELSSCAGRFARRANRR